MYEVIVVGAGIIGSWTACILAERGNKVLLVDQFPLPHTRSSSHGTLRGTSLSTGNRLELELNNVSIQYWNKLNDDVGETLSWTFPLLDICDPKGFQRQEDIFNSLPGECEWLSGEQLRQRCTSYEYPLNHRGLLQKSCLIIKANQVLKSLQERFRQLGGEIVDNFMVEKIKTGTSIEVIGSGGKYQSKKLALCAGGWSAHLLSMLDLHLPLVCLAAVNQYFQLKEGFSLYPQIFLSLQSTSEGVLKLRPKLPRPSEAVNFSFSHNLRFETCNEDGDRFSGFVVETPPGCLRIVTTQGTETDPDDRDNADIEEILRKTQEHVKRYWPGLHEKPCSIEKCMYTMTPDSTLICDRHPLHSNVVFAAGFSGAGFKCSPAVAEILADLLEDKTPRIQYNEAKLDRFL